MRLFYEYLPLTFSRRHGDPSRPWNLFSIRVNDAEGNRLISYQGNWRDIFQNWEALSVSYPGYVNGIIAKFLNATTADGYNPYKVTSEGIDWELINPEDPWSNIGYWGDHQIIYLLKLLELSYDHDPDALRSLLNARLFAFANVPYKFKSYQDIVADPKNSVVFDPELHERIMRLLPEYGQDARLMLNAEGGVHLATFTEKILVGLLVKMSNMIPGAGVWMNTLRPEWNDANNALVGYGASMVTLCYIRRYAEFLHKLYQSADDNFEISAEIADLVSAIAAAAKSLLTAKSPLSGCNIRTFIDTVGLAGEHYRNAVYRGHSGSTCMLKRDEMLSLMSNIRSLCDLSIRANRREDGLYNAYNTIRFVGDDSMEIETLYPMLEGQVAVLSAGVLSAEEAADLLETMRHSDLYRPDQHSYMLYPARRRLGFLEKNNLPEEVNQWKELPTLIAADIIRRDVDGGLHFNPAFNNADFLSRHIDSLPADQKERILHSPLELRSSILNLYEDVFHHHSFTGRSGTFYKYEGLGCIYWHMVSKLLLAVGETIARAEAAGADDEVLQRLHNCYFDIRAGIGAHKSPAEYGSFPFDPYSHTPSMSGVQQPGMTGQVKEDILSRFFELGVRVVDGCITICPTMLRREEFSGDELRFSYCGTIFVYKKGDHSEGLVLDRETSRHIFMRDGQVPEVVVTLNV